MKTLLSSFCFLLFVYSCTYWRADAKVYLFKRDTCPLEECGFEKIALDLNNDQLFVGGSDHLYQLERNLDLIQDIDLATNRSCTLTKTCLPSTNEILMVDDDQRRVLFCSRSSGFSCSLHDVNDVTNVLRDTIYMDKCPATRNNEDVVSFIAETGGKNYIYMAIPLVPSECNSGQVLRPPISKLNFPKDSSDKNMLNHITEFFKGQFRVKFKKPLIQQHWVGGYFLEKYTYFIKWYEKDLQIRTYITRFCHVGSAHRSEMVEIPLSCRGKDGKDYNKITNSHMMQFNKSTRNHDKHLLASFVSTSPDVFGAAVCIFSITEIENYFKMMASNCDGSDRFGVHSRSIPWVVRDTYNCRGIDFGDKDDICKANTVSNLQALESLTKDTIYDGRDLIASSVTSLAMDEYSKRFVVFVGTGKSQVAKIRYDANLQSHQLIEHIQVGEVKIDRNDDEYYVRSMAVYPEEYDRSQSTLYALNNHVVAATPVQNCSQYTTCQQCTQSFDPFCGWCTFEDKCSTIGDCRGSDPEQKFIETGKSCPQLDLLTTDDTSGTLQVNNNISIEKFPSELQLLAGSVPVEEKDKYLCRFKGRVQTKAHIRPKEAGDQSYVTCMSPNKNDVDFQGSPSQVIEVELVYVKHPDKKVSLASCDVNIYKCSDYSSCYSCIKSGYKCSWDNMKHECGDSNDIVSTQNCPVVSGISASSDSEFNNNTFYILKNSNADIKLSVKGLQLTPAGTTYNIKCRVEYPDSRGAVADEYKATLDESYTSIVCFKVLGKLSETAGTSTRAKLSVFLVKPGSKEVEINSKDQLTIEVFQCEMKRETSCGNCLSTNKYWKCGWCTSSQKCTRKDACAIPSPYTPDDDSSKDDGWMSAGNNQVCSNPQILQVKPLMVAVGSSTQVLLVGKNFDQQLKMKITMAGVLCNPLRFLNDDTTKLLCELNASGSGPTKDTSGKVELCITDGVKCRAGPNYNSTYTQQDFKFLVPTITRVEPEKVLKYWGSTLVLKGSNLNVGNKMLIKYGNDQICSFDGQQDREAELVTCQMTCKSNDVIIQPPGSSSEKKKRSTASRRMSLRHNHRVLRHNNNKHAIRHKRQAVVENVIRISFDGGPEMTKSLQMYDEVAISNVEPLSTIQSGGLNVLINGTNIGLIDQPTMRVMLDDGRKSQGKACIVQNDDVLNCSTPSIKPLLLHKPYQNFQQSVRFEIVSSSERCAGPGVTSPRRLTYYPDPVISEELSEETFSAGEVLLIKGDRICPEEQKTCAEKDVKVIVGSEMCRVTEVLSNQIQCTLTNKMSDGDHVVQVWIGDTFTQQVGRIKYQAPQNGISFITVIVIVVVIIIVLIVFVIMMYKCHKKMESRGKEVREIQFKMNKLESEVAKACKEAFAELQTDQDEGRVVSGKAAFGPPYHDYRIYLIRVLFPDPTDSDRLLDSLLLSTENGNLMTNHRRVAMNRFQTLLRNEGFLIMFIHTLEGQRSFSMKDKAYVAGLVLIVLQDRLAYATHILEKLLAELIQKGVSKETHPKLLFRRTESVAEKMLTHWFSMLLYGFLVAGAGDSLYLLYRRLCQLIDKGPVDAMTNDARYSLSEDKLLRQSLEANKVVLKVSNYFEDDRKIHNIKVLTCDSISQVKRKILDYLYGHVAYSQRVHPHKVDLEWKRKGEQVGTILRDEDTTTRSEGEWRPINTIEHYQIPENASISVIPKKVGTLPHNYASSSSVVSGSAVSRGYMGFSKQDSTTRLLPASTGNTSSGEGSLPRRANHKNHHGSRPETPHNTSISSTQQQSTISQNINNENIRYYHLTKPTDQEMRASSGQQSNNISGGGPAAKMVAEVYLTRLLTAKVALQKHVDDFFETVFSVEQRDQTLPIAVRHMFSFLDDQARKHNIQDQDIVHTWKTNCLPLRFWVNLIKNPEFVYDIYKSSIVDSCLSVIGQTFMDSCALGRQPLTKDSPTNKLLYAKEIPKYKNWVSKYYGDISNKPRLDRRQIESYLNEESRRHQNDFNTEAALNQLFEYVQKYSGPIHKALGDSSEGRRLQLSNQLKQIEDAYSSKPMTLSHPLSKGGPHQYGSNGALSTVGRRPPYP